MYSQCSTCPSCGAPIWVPQVWHGTTPPPVTYGCNCRMETITVYNPLKISRHELDKLPGTFVPLKNPSLGDTIIQWHRPLSTTVPQKDWHFASDDATKIT